MANASHQSRLEQIRRIKDQDKRAEQLLLHYLARETLRPLSGESLLAVEATHLALQGVNQDIEDTRFFERIASGPDFVAFLDYVHAIRMYIISGGRYTAKRIRQFERYLPENQPKGVGYHDTLAVATVCGLVSALDFWTKGEQAVVLKELGGNLTQFEHRFWTMFKKMIGQDYKVSRHSLNDNDHFGHFQKHLADNLASYLFSASADEHRQARIQKALADVYFQIVDSTSSLDVISEVIVIQLTRLHFKRLPAKQALNILTRQYR